MRIDGTEYGRAPIDHPLEYPGRTPPWSFLFTGDEVHAVRAGPGADLDSLHVAREDEPEVGAAPRRLDVVLAEMGASPLASRTPVLAYGSNACPGQLRSKFAGLAGPRAIPVLRCELVGWRTAFAARLAGYGSVPATIVPDTTSRIATWLNLLDDAELEVMDDTEGIAYRRADLAGQASVTYRDVPVAEHLVRAYVAPVALDLDRDGLADPFDPAGQRRVLDQVAAELAALGHWRLRTADDVVAAAAAGTLPSARASATMEQQLGVRAERGGGSGGGS